MASTQRPTGIFDLPLELRQQIYTDVLLKDRAIRYSLRDSTTAHERTAVALCAAHPVLNNEVEAWLYKHCDAIVTVVPDTEFDLPYGVEWSRFRSISVHIDYVSCPGGFDSGFPGIRQFVDSLMFGDPKRFPDFGINFLEDGNPYRRERRPIFRPDATKDYAYANTDWYSLELDTRLPRRPRQWPIDLTIADAKQYFDLDTGSEDSDFYGDDEGSIRETLCMKYDRNTTGMPAPYAVLVLDPFLRLPICKSATVEGLWELGSHPRARFI